MRWSIAVVGLLGVWMVATASARGRAAAPADPPGSHVVAYLVIDADTGAVLAEREQHKKWPPASMTKMMTVLIAMERVKSGAAKLDEPVHASAWASKIGGSQVYLKAGETFPLGDLLKSIMIASANDSAVAVAEHIAGSQAAFVEKMNARAKELGLDDTTYQTPHGLPPAKGQLPDISSAHDLAVLGRELMKYPEVMQWAATPQAGFRNDTLQMSNTNHLVRGMFPGATGLKTGYYVDAGFEITATATRDGLNLLAVVLGVPDKRESFTEAARLLGEGFASHRTFAATKRGAIVGKVPVTGGTTESVDAVATRDVRLVVKAGDEAAVTLEPHFTPDLAAPVGKDQSIGEVVVKRGGEEVARVPVVAGAAVESSGWMARIRAKAPR